MLAVMLIMMMTFLQCFDTVGWVTEGHLASK